MLLPLLQDSAIRFAKRDLLHSAGGAILEKVTMADPEEEDLGSSAFGDSAPHLRVSLCSQAWDNTPLDADEDDLDSPTDSFTLERLSGTQRYFYTQSPNVKNKPKRFSSQQRWDKYRATIDNLTRGNQIWLTESLRLLYRDAGAREALIGLGACPTLLSLLEAAAPEVVHGACLVLALLAGEAESSGTWGAHLGLCIQGAVTALMRVVASPRTSSRIAALRALQEFTAAAPECCDELGECGALPVIVQLMLGSSGSGATHSACVLAHAVGRNPGWRDQLLGVDVCTAIAFQIAAGGRAAVAAARLMWAMLGSCSGVADSASPWMSVLGEAWSPQTPVEMSAEMGAFNETIDALWMSGSLHQCVELLEGNPKRPITESTAFAAGAIANLAVCPTGFQYCSQAGAASGLLQLLARACSQLSSKDQARKDLVERTAFEASRALWSLTCHQRAVVPLLGESRAVAVLMLMLTKEFSTEILAHTVMALKSAHAQNLAGIGQRSVQALSVLLAHQDAGIAQGVGEILVGAVRDGQNAKDLVVSGGLERLSKVVHNLLQNSGSEHRLSHLARTLLVLSHPRSGWVQNALVEGSVLDLLIQMLCTSHDSATARAAAKSIANLSSLPAFELVLADQAGLTVLSALLGSHDHVVAQAARKMADALVVTNATDALAMLLTLRERCLERPYLRDHLLDPAAAALGPHTRNIAAVDTVKLAMSFASTSRDAPGAVESGVGALVQQLSSRDAEVLAHATLSLWGLAHLAHNKDLIRDADGLAKLTKLLKHRDKIVRENAIGALWELSSV